MSRRKNAGPDLFEAAIIRGMTRANDHRTSVQAAKSAAKTKMTKRDHVIAFARMQPEGFTDDDLVRMRPDFAESTLRKRRTELTAENIILDTGRTARKPSNGEEVIVWVHRDHHQNPPPIVERGPQGPTKKELQAEVSRLTALLNEHGIAY